MISGDNMDGGGTLSVSPSMSGDLDISECLKGIMGCMPPPFLIKTYNIVDDPKTNSIISWSSSGTSFIIWDHLKFSAEILPLYFKHNILSSFVSQLNNYGFRKIGVDHQWEYENPYFQAGNEYMLANIKRRNQIPERVPRRKSKKKLGGCSSAVIGNASHNMETKLETLRNEMETSKLEIQKLKKQQQDMQLHLSTLEADMIHNVRNQYNNLLMVLSEKGEEFLVQKNSTDDESGEKRKLDNSYETSVNKKHYNITATN